MAAGPFVGVRIKPFAGEEERVQRVGVVVPQQDSLRILLLDRPNRRRRREDRLHPVLLDDPPEGSGIGCTHRLAFVQHGGCTADQWRVNDVGMPDHPADVGCRPPDVTGTHAVDVRERPRHGNRVSTVVSNNPLGLPGSSRGVENVKRVRRRNLHRLHRRSASQYVVPLHIARPHICGYLGALENHDALDTVLAHLDCRIDQRLVFHCARRLDPARGRDDHFWFRIIDS